MFEKIQDFRITPPTSTTPKKKKNVEGLSGCQRWSLQAKCERLESWGYFLLIHFSFCAVSHEPINVVSLFFFETSLKGLLSNHNPFSLTQIPLS